MWVGVIDRLEEMLMTKGVRGFTLIELLIVVVMIGILVLIALPSFSGARERAYRAQMQTDLRTLVTAQEAYYESNLAYADAIALLDVNNTPLVTLEILDVNGTGFSAKAIHGAVATECGLYVGSVTPPAGIPLPNEGVIGCTN